MGQNKKYVDGNFRVYFYVTMKKPYLWYLGGKYYSDEELRELHLQSGKMANGMVCAVCEYCSAEDYQKSTEEENRIIEKRSCVSKEQIAEYCKKDKRLLALRLGRCNLIEPDELFEFLAVDGRKKEVKAIKKAPVSWQYAYPPRDLNHPMLERCALISIRPEWFLKMAKREKVIELRHTLPKEIGIY